MSTQLGLDEVLVVRDAASIFDLFEQAFKIAFVKEGRAHQAIQIPIFENKHFRRMNF